MSNITIDGQTHDLASLSEEAHKQIASIQFVDAEITKRQNEIAAFQTARIAYAQALKQALASKN